MKLNKGQQVLAAMCEADLQLGWQMLDAGKFDLTIHHFKEAIIKVEQMRDASPDPKAPKVPKQLIIGV